MCVSNPKAKKKRDPNGADDKSNKISQETLSSSYIKEPDNLNELSKRSETIEEEYQKMVSSVGKEDCTIIKYGHNNFKPITTSKSNKLAFVQTMLEKDNVQNHQIPVQLVTSLGIKKKQPSSFQIKIPVQKLEIYSEQQKTILDMLTYMSKINTIRIGRKKRTINPKERLSWQNEDIPKSDITILKETNNKQT